MPTFEFISPDGKSYSVEGPEGATKEQAFSMLQTQLANESQQKSVQQPQPEQHAATTAQDRARGALAGLQDENKLNSLVNGKPEPSPTLKSAGEAIAGSGVVGATLGAASPEILTGLGIAAKAVPEVGPALSAVLTTAGSAARANRWAAAGTGLISGLGGEAAGQAATAAGASKSTADTARFVGGMSAGSLGSLAMQFVPKALQIPVKAVQALVGGEVQSVPKAVEAARENLAKATEAGQPQHQMHAMLQAGVEADRQAAEKAADAVIQRSIADANRIAATDATTATRIIEDGRTQSQSIRDNAAKRANALEKASDGKLKTANKILAQADNELKTVGNTAPASDIGNTLRQAASEKQGAALQARNEAYRATAAERDAIVNAKEAEGNTIDKLPEMKALKEEIGKYTLSNQKGREAAKGLARATDPGVVRAYKSVEDAINNKRVQVGVDPETGNPKYQTFKTSFEAIDAVRRRLGDALAGGQDVEGYSALGKNIAQKLYQRLSNVQEKFVGEQGGRNLQRELQSGYAEASGGVRSFGTKSGQKLTAIDRVDPERFSADPQGLPKYFFSSQQSVRDAVELTGNKDLVVNAAKSHAANELQGMSSKQVKQWAQKNNDWTREIPGLQKSVSDYANKLEQIERVSDKLGKRAATAVKEAESTLATGNKLADQELVEARKRAGQAAEGSVASQQRVLDEGQKAAKETFKQQHGPSERLGSDLRSGEAPEAVRSLLLNGKPEQTRLAASYLANQPGGQKVLEDSVRQSIRNMSEKTLQKEWVERVRPMLVDGKMLPPDRMQALETDVNRLLQSYKGKDKMTLIQRHIVAALASAGVADGSFIGRK